MARDGYRRRTVDPALLAAPALLFTLGRINCRQLSAHKPEGGSLYSACYPRCWVRAVSGGACHGLRWPFRLSSSRHAPGRAGDRLRRAPNRYDTETKVRSTRWTMSGSSASAIAITTRIPGNGIFRRRKKHAAFSACWTASGAVPPPGQASYRQPPIYAGRHRISESKPILIIEIS
jgi:hypothetical protein